MGELELRILLDFAQGTDHPPCCQQRGSPKLDCATRDKSTCDVEFGTE